MSIFLCIAGLFKLYIAFYAGAHRGDFAELPALDIASVISRLYEGSVWDFSKYKGLVTAYGTTNMAELIITGVLSIAAGVFLFIFKRRQRAAHSYSDSQYRWRIVAAIFVPIAFMAVMSPIMWKIMAGEWNVWKRMAESFGEEVSLSDGIYHVSWGVMISLYCSGLYSMLIWRRMPKERSAIAFPCCLGGAFVVAILICKTICIGFGYTLILIMLLLMLAGVLIVGKVLGWFSDTSVGKAVSSAAEVVEETYLDQEERRREEMERAEEKRRMQQEEVDRVDRKLWRSGSDDLSIEEKGTLADAARRHDSISKNARDWYENGGHKY